MPRHAIPGVETPGTPCDSTPFGSEVMSTCVQSSPDEVTYRSLDFRDSFREIITVFKQISICLNHRLVD